MSKIILEFDGIEEADDARTALDGSKWKISIWSLDQKISIWSLDQWLRSQIKYAPDDMSDDTYKAFEECREKLREIVNDINLSLD
jgi:predicted transglutaminase-like protease